MKKLAPLAVLIGLASLPSLASADGGMAVKMEADDGFVLEASYYDPGKPGPGVLLLHQCNADRTMWDGIAERLKSTGLHVLSLDYRGYGGSKRGKVDIDTASRDQRRELGTFARADIETALAYLQRRKGVDGTRLATGGASCGGPRSIHLAAGKPGFKTMVFLSTYVDDNALHRFEQLNDIPILVITAVDDGQTTSSLEKLFAASKSGKSRLQLYKGGQHGYPLFTLDRSLERQIAEWYRQHLR